MQWKCRREAAKLFNASHSESNYLFFEMRLDGIFLSNLFLPTIPTGGGGDVFIYMYIVYFFF